MSDQGNPQAAAKVYAGWAAVMQGEQIMAGKTNDKATGAANPELQQAYDKATEQGFWGVEVDPTPNENYTVAGQVKNAPTPETDKAAKAEAKAHAETVAEQFAGPTKE